MVKIGTYVFQSWTGPVCAMDPQDQPPPLCQPPRRREGRFSPPSMPARVCVRWIPPPNLAKLPPAPQFIPLTLAIAAATHQCVVAAPTPIVFSIGIKR